MSHVKRLFKQAEFTRCGLTTYAGTLTEAKHEWERTIKDAFDGTYTPIVLSFKGKQCLVYRDARHGWCDTLIHDEYLNTDLHSVSFSSMTRDETIASCRHHLAQLAWSPGVDITEYIAYIDNNDYERQFISWVKFQDEYARLRATGLTDYEAHRQACGG